MKILLDTDPGSDIDDAIAIAYLARHPDCELLGVTTVTGDVRKRAAIVEIVLDAFGGKNVPIAAGASDVLLYGPGQPEVPQFEFVADRSHHMDRPVDAGVALLREKIKEHAGEVTLLTIGPLTNIATLLLLDREIASSISHVVSMVGWFHFEPADTSKGSEWNAECDPLASAIFFNRCTCPLTVVPLDTTLQCTMTRADFQERFAKSPHDVILKMATNWFKTTDRVIFHDPLAAVVAFNPDVCTYRTGSVTATNDNGYTTLSGGGAVRVADKVNVQAFFDEYFRVVG